MGDPEQEHQGHGYSYGDDAKRTNAPRMGDHAPEPAAPASDAPAGDGGDAGDAQDQ